MIEIALPGFPSAFMMNYGKRRFNFVHCCCSSCFFYFLIPAHVKTLQVFTNMWYKYELG